MCGIVDFRCGSPDLILDQGQDTRPPATPELSKCAQCPDCRSADIQTPQWPFIPVPTRNYTLRELARKPTLWLSSQRWDAEKYRRASLLRRVKSEQSSWSAAVRRVSIQRKTGKFPVMFVIVSFRMTGVWTGLLLGTDSFRSLCRWQYSTTYSVWCFYHIAIF